MIKQKNIAIIPARGGSKRIPRKNIKDFLGKPIIAYSIEAALKSNLFDEVMVSTDDKEIAEIAKKYGANVPFMRSKENSDDYTGPGDVVFEVIQEYKKNKMNFTSGCCIYATAPFIKPDTLIAGHKLLHNNEFETVLPVVKYSYPIWRSYKMLDTSEIIMNFPENERKRSQDLPDAFYDAGQFYWFNVKNFTKLKNKNIFGEKRGCIILDEKLAQDIDNPEDWEMAEIKYKLLNKVSE